MTVPLKPIKLTTKQAKISIAVDLADFPFAAVPAPGTVGAKTMVLTLLCDTGHVIFKATMRVPNLQKLAATVAASAVQDGFVVLQGKLGPDNTLVEAGAIFQPKSPAAAASS